MAILLDPYTTLCTRGLTLESLASSQTCSSSNLLILKLNTVLGFPLQICVENTLLLLTFVCNLAGILSNSLHPPSQTGLNFPKVKTYFVQGLKLVAKDFYCWIYTGSLSQIALWKMCLNIDFDACGHFILLLIFGNRLCQWWVLAIFIWMSNNRVAKVFPSPAG